MIFGEENDNLDQAYDNFKTLWKRNGLDRQKESPWRKISFSTTTEYVSRDQRFACYHVKAYLLGSVELTKDPKTPQGQIIKKQYFTLADGIDHCFIVDLLKSQVIGIDDVFQPAVASKLKGMFGDMVSLYAEDRCLQILSSKGEGRFFFSTMSEPNFTDYFKQLVG